MWSAGKARTGGLWAHLLSCEHRLIMLDQHVLELAEDLQRRARRPALPEIRIAVKTTLHEKAAGRMSVLGSLWCQGC